MWGMVVSSVSAGGTASNYFYNNLRQRTQKQVQYDAAGTQWSTTAWTYLASGKVSSVTDPNGNTDRKSTRLNSSHYS